MTDQQRKDAARTAFVAAGGDPAQFDAYYAAHTQAHIDSERAKLEGLTSAIANGQRIVINKPRR